MIDDDSKKFEEWLLYFLCCFTPSSAVFQNYWFCDEEGSQMTNKLLLWRSIKIQNSVPYGPQMVVKNLAGDVKRHAQ